MISLRKVATTAPSSPQHDATATPEGIGTIVTRSACEAMTKIWDDARPATQLEGSAIIASQPSNSFA